MLDSRIAPVVVCMCPNHVGECRVHNFCYPGSWQGAEAWEQAEQEQLEALHISSRK